MSLNNQFCFLAPVEVVKVTSENIQEAAEWCGGTIHEAESRRVKGRMDQYILAPTPKSSSTAWAFPGMFITKRLVTTEKGQLKATFAVFRKDYFQKNYFDTVQASVEATWERSYAEAVEDVARETSVKSAMLEALEEHRSATESRDLPSDEEIDIAVTKVKDFLKPIAVEMAIDTSQPGGSEKLILSVIREQDLAYEEMAAALNEKPRP